MASRWRLGAGGSLTLNIPILSAAGESSSSLWLGLVTAVLAATVPLDALADLVSIGTLAAFIVVAIGVIVLRKTAPELPRTFRCPWVPVLPIAGVLINLYLMGGLSIAVWIRFVVWLVVGLALYFSWGHRSASRVFAQRTTALPAEFTEVSP